VSEAVDYILQACEGLAEAHASGVIHRDLKPANLFLATRSDGSRRIKVLDFGVSKQLVDLEAQDRALTITNSLVGSPLYMSPEQLESPKDVDRRVDVWGLGAVLYELLAGRTAFDGDNIAQVIRSVVEAPPAPCPGLPPELQAVISRALAKRRDHRYASVAELAAALAPFASVHGATSAARVFRVLSADSAADSAGLAVSEPAARAARAPSTPLNWIRPSTPESGRRRLRIAALAVVLVALAVALLLYLDRDREQPPARPRAPVSAAASTALPGAKAESGLPATQPLPSAPPDEPAPPAAVAQPGALAAPADRPEARESPRDPEPPAQAPAVRPRRLKPSALGRPSAQPGVIEDFGGRR
jgi:serine/threonine-protein kinase